MKIWKAVWLLPVCLAWSCAYVLALVMHLDADKAMRCMRCETVLLPEDQ